ncbi:MAG: VWA domain-containing protein, partial [Planctomycetota bacterium]|nr:VWA domain-containing protein [Planctomycetota bacterium]
MYAAAIEIGFEAPWWLLTALAAAGPIALAAWGRRRGKATTWWRVGVQCLALLAAAVALARPHAPIGEAARRPWLLANDHSASLRGQEKAPWTWPGGWAKEDVLFADALGTPAVAPNAQATRIAPLLSLLRSRAGELAAAVIRTDGRFQDDPWQADAAALGQTGLGVWIVPADAVPADARVADLAARLAADGKAHLRLTVSANAYQARQLTVTETRRKATLYDRRLHLTPGENVVIELTDTPAPGATAIYQAALSAGDAFPENDLATVALPPARRLAAVLTAAGARDVSNALAASNMPLSAISDAAAPDDPDAWLPYSAVCLVDPTGTGLSIAQRNALARYVLAGGGLVVVGAGPCQSPADFTDPLNQILPLVANPYQRKPMKVIVLLDASGSMGERPPGAAGAPAAMRKFDLAVEALATLKEHLTDQDGLAVIRFSETGALVYDTDGADGRGKRRIDMGEVLAIDRRTPPAGSTKIKPALELALAAAPTDGRDGLVLIVSDLETQDADLRPAELAGRLERAKLTLAAVATVPAEEKLNPDLERLLELAHSPAIRSEKLSGLADLFARFVRRIRGGPVRHGAFALAADGPVFSAATLALPPLTAYLPSAVKGDATILARVGADPVLARRSAGAGKAVAIALPLAGADNEALPGSPAFVALLTDALAWSARAEGDSRFAGELTQLPRARRLTVTAADPAGPMDSLTLSCTLTRPEEPVP